MSVKVRPYRRGGWEVDVQVVLPDGRKLRERRKACVQSKSAAKRWGEERERHLLVHGQRKNPQEVPTLEQFKDRFIEGHCKANKHKPSGIEGKEYAFRNHLLPLFGSKRLDKFTQEDVARLKSRLVNHKPATVNNILSVLSMTLRVAAEWNVVESVPVRIRLLKVQKATPGFYDFDHYEDLVAAAAKADPRIHLLVLLGGDAGLRRGEIIALEQTDVDLRRNHLTVQRSEWKGRVNETKGMECRVVPLTKRLAAALAANRHLRGDRLLYTDAGETLTAKVVHRWLERVQRRANLKATGGSHVLRHSFCSHLAMRGAPALSIQKLAGHKNLQTTLRYMHLSQGETDRAIGLLDQREPAPGRVVGDILETPTLEPEKLNRVG